MPKNTKHAGPSYEWDIAPEVTEGPPEITEPETPAGAPEEPSVVTKTSPEVDETTQEPYDPAQHGAQHVVDYLATVDDDERARVGEREQQAARPRKSVLSAAGFNTE